MKKPFLLGAIFTLAFGWVAVAQTIAPISGATSCAGLSDAGVFCNSTNASGLTGTVASARIAGAYTGITGLGTLATGAVPTTLLTGTLATAQVPAMTGVINNSAGSLTTSFAPNVGALTATTINMTGALKTTVTTVSGLPSCTAALQGARYTVTDSLLPASLAIVANGGAVIVGVLCNGTNWIVS